MIEIAIVYCMFFKFISIFRPSFLLSSFYFNLLGVASNFDMMARSILDIAEPSRTWIAHSSRKNSIIVQQRFSSWKDKEKKKKGTVSVDISLFLFFGLIVIGRLFLFCLEKKSWRLLYRIGTNDQSFLLTNPVMKYATIFHATVWTWIKYSYLILLKGENEATALIRWEQRNGFISSLLSPRWKEGCTFVGKFSKIGNINPAKLIPTRESDSLHSL